MKVKVLVIISSLMLTMPLFAQDDNSANKNDSTTGELKVIVAGLKNDNGSLQIGLFNSEASWKGKAEKFKGAIIKIKDKRAEWVLQDIPYGEYGIRFFHDEDDDGEMDKNFLGMPKEDYGFSNNAKATFGMPGYKKVKFIFDEQNNIVKIKK